MVSALTPLVGSQKGHPGCKGSDTLESFLSKVAVKSDLRKETCKNRTRSDRESLFRKKKNCKSSPDTRAGFLSKVTFDSCFRKKTS